MLAWLVVAAALPAQLVTTYNRDVAPLMYERCAECHRPAGSAPFSLLTFQDVRKRATRIVEVTQQRYMPPWKPEPAASAAFADSRRLSEQELAVIARWARDGFIEGDSADLPPPPRWDSEWRLGKPDLVVTAEPYALPADGTDVFRTLVVRIPGDRVRHVRALELRPGSTRVIHHANIKIDSTDSSRRLDENDPGPGYDGAGGRGAGFPDGHFLGWTPGQSPRSAVADSTWRLPPRADLVLELHMMPTGKAEIVQPSVGFYFADRDSDRLPAMIRLGRQDLDIPPGTAKYISTDSYTLPAGVDVLALQPHAHRLATDIRAWATLPSGATLPLISIESWDMSWQDTYVLERPLFLPGGTRISMRYTYDNSPSNPRAQTPPRRVTFGQTTSSEMGDLWIQVLPRTTADRDAVRADVAAKMLSDDIAGVEKMLEMMPEDPRIRTDLGFCYLEAGRTSDAVFQLAEAARLAPRSAAARHDLAVVLLRERRFAEARPHFEAAVRLKPDFFEAYANLGAVNHAEGKLRDAVGWYERSLAIEPDNGVAEYNLGRALASLGESDAAVEHYRSALRLSPDDVQTHVGLASLLASNGRANEAVDLYRRALDLDPNSAAAILDLAWILATSEQPALQRPAEAVRLAERGVELTGRTSPTAFDVLAAAHASTGDFDRAIENAERAASLASQPEMKELSDAIHRRLRAYREAARR